MQKPRFLRRNKNTSSCQTERESPPVVHLLPHQLSAKGRNDAARNRDRLHVAPSAEREPSGDRGVLSSGVGRETAVALFDASPGRPVAEHEVGRQSQRPVHDRGRRGLFNPHTG